MIGDGKQISFSNTFQWSSATKIVTAIGALQCVDRGQIVLDDTVYQYLPELRDQPIVSLIHPGNNQEPGIKLSPTTRQITLRHLLTHTSGIASDFMHPALMAWRKTRGETTKAFSGDAIESINQPLAFDPGQGWTYGASYDALGLLIARLNNLPDLENYLISHIFAPLNLQHSTSMPEDHPDILKQLAETYTHSPADGTLIPYTHGTTGRNPTLSQGGGGLYASVPDYTAILADIVSESPKLLTAETADLLFSPQLAKDTQAFKDFENSRPLFDALLGPLSRGGVEINHSLGGVLVLEDAEGVVGTKGTAAWAGAMGTFWMANRQRRVVAVYASQLFPIHDEMGLRLVEGFVREVWRLVGDG